MTNTDPIPGYTRYPNHPTTTVTRTGRYPVAAQGALAPSDTPNGAMFEWTGEFRRPESGEWFLSNHPPVAYHAPHGHPGIFHIGRLVDPSRA